MSEQLQQFDKLHELLIGLDDDRREQLDDAAWSRLTELLRNDPVARRNYLQYMLTDAVLRLEHAVPPAALDRRPAAGNDPEGALKAEGGESDFSAGAAAEPTYSPESSTVPFPPLSTLPSPLSSPFVGGPVFSYVVATLILGIMLLGAWAYTITRNQNVDYVHNNSRELTAPGGSADKTSDMLFVGRVTGMKDCRWSEPSTATSVGSSVPLKRRYALASGLLEITYRSGARVILEGPCSYEVDARDGGFLSLGKLTARIEKSGRGGEREKGRLAGSTDQSPNLPLTSSPTLLFSVRTPTAIVTDLGTEFGVEVSEQGNTLSQVFRGAVKVEVTGEDQNRTVILRENESARVEKCVDSGDVRLSTGVDVGTPSKFVRRLYEPPKLLDLLDIVAGGNGTGSRRERGIDQTTGMQTAEFINEHRRGFDRYRPVYWHRLIDGVFVPDSRFGPVQLDSAGHTFDALPATTGATWGSLWSRSATIEKDASYVNWIRAIGNCPRFTPDGRGLLAFNSNMGVAFNLMAMRKTFADARPGRLAAIAAMADARFNDPHADGLADLWVFVDGRLKFKRTGIRPQDEPFRVEVELGPDDRFLTLISTDGGNTPSCDWLLLGDPVLEMIPAAHENLNSGARDNTPTTIDLNQKERRSIEP